jgi:hypothetical protein
MAYNPSNPNGQATMANSAPVVLASDQKPLQIGDVGTSDTFGNLRVAMASNDIDEQFFRDDPNNILNVTGSGGTASQESGYARFSTGAGSSNTIKAVSLDKTHYHSGGEIYALFTAAFVTGSVVNVTQRIGLFESVAGAPTNGFYVGYDATSSFGCGIANGGTNTFTQKANFNVDTLGASASSKFTSNGVPVAIDPTKSNIFRIRFGWLGAANIRYEICSPDGEWVLFHVIRQPNSSPFPSIRTADLPMTVEIIKSAAALISVDIYCNCWGAGIQYNSGDWYDSSTLGTAVDSVIEYNTNGLGSANIYLGTSSTGTMTFEATIDGKNWFTHPGVQDPNINGSDLIIEAPVTPVGAAWYKVPLTGYRGLRVRTVTALSLAVPIGFVGDTHDIVNNISPPAHNIGYPQVHKDATYVTTQTSAVLWTPATGKKFVVTDLTISTGGTIAGTITLYQAASASAYTLNSTPAIFRGEFAPTTTSKPGLVKNFIYPYMSTTANHLLYVTTTGFTTGPVYVQVNGYEIY